jgi:hypothetical protein
MVAKFRQNADKSETMLRISGSAPKSVIDCQHHYSADDRYHNAVKVDPGDSVPAEGAENPPARDRPHDPQDNIEEKALTLFIYDLACDKPRNQAQNDPCEK